MRIDSSNRPERQGPLAGAALPQPTELNGAQPAAQAARPESTEAVHQDYIRRAVATDDVDMQAVAEAKRLIEAGQLDTPEAIAAAAEKIVINGI